MVRRSYTRCATEIQDFYNVSKNKAKSMCRGAKGSIRLIRWWVGKYRKPVRASRTHRRRRKGYRTRGRKTRSKVASCAMRTKWQYNVSLKRAWSMCRGAKGHSHRIHHWAKRYRPVRRAHY